MMKNIVGKCFDTMSIYTGNLKDKGITLIALIITIIILLIMAGVTILTITGENGMLSRSSTAADETNKQGIKEKLEFVFQEALVEESQNKEYNSNEFLDGLIKTRIPEAEIEEDKVKIEKYEFTIDRKKLKIISIEEIKTNNIIDNASLIGEVSKISESGYHEIEVTGKNAEGTEETVKYATNMIIKDGDLVLDGTTTVEGATLESNVYEFGNKETDVATASENARNMVILKVNGNLTINEGVTLTACKSDSGYGGPKGLLVYCTGTLTNNGTISMTARGARAEGQNVYLWKNKNESYEYIPNRGGRGGDSVYCSWNGINLGLKGEDAAESTRQTGGGGSGAARHWIDSSGTSGKGGYGTSYSGGSGGGGNDCRESVINSPDASNIGGDGGFAYASYSNGHGCAGGTGNPGGSFYVWYDCYQGMKGNDGTGGLLIVYSKKIYNNNLIQANGISGVDYWAGGGSSGGGSVNIFFNDKLENIGTIEALGGQSTNGGSGGNGSITIGNISTGTFVKDE